MDYGYMQQPGWISKELCSVKNASPKSLRIASIYMTFLKRQNFRDEDRLMVSSVR